MKVFFPATSRFSGPIGSVSPFIMQFHRKFPFRVGSSGSSCHPLIVGLSAIALLTLTSGCSVSSARKVMSSAIAPAAATNPAKISLAEHLNKNGAKLYSTFWCPYCNRQKEMFGDAANDLAVIECDPNGKNAQPALCASANISSYPTWEINGQLYRGMRSLDELAEISGYQGSREFGS